MHLAKTSMTKLKGYEFLWDYPHNLATCGEGAVRQPAHQANAAAAINDTDPGLCKPLANLKGCVQIDRVYVV
jgi:hypothetical protein